MARAISFSGVYTAIVTPFTEDGNQVDYEALGRLVESQVAGGVTGIVPVGTTGESPALTAEEKKKVISFCVEKVAKRIQVIAGTGSNFTATSVEATQIAKDLGVDAVLIVNPYYNKPSQEGLYQHVKAVAKVGVPIMLYNIPGRTGITMNPATVVSLYNDCPEICGIKEATGSLDIASEIASLCDIPILSGDDSLTLPLMSIGGKGVVSVLSNLAPEKVVAMVQNAASGNFAEAAKQHCGLFKMFKNMFVESNPVPCKYAMYLNGMCSPAVRLPLVQMEKSSEQILVDTLIEQGLVSEQGLQRRTI